MKYLIEATGKLDNGEYGDVEIPTEIEFDGDRENTSFIFVFNNKEVWIPVTELDHLMYIVDGLMEE